MFSARVRTGDWTDELPMPVPHVESVGEQLVGCASVAAKVTIFMMVSHTVMWREFAVRISE